MTTEEQGDFLTGTPRCVHCGGAVSPEALRCASCHADLRVPIHRSQHTLSRLNGTALAAFVLGILWLFFLGSLLAVVLGSLAKRQIADSSGVQTGEALAQAAIVLGWVGLGLLGLLFGLQLLAIPFRLV